MSDTCSLILLLLALSPTPLLSSSSCRFCLLSIKALTKRCTSSISPSSSKAISSTLFLSSFTSPKSTFCSTFPNFDSCLRNCYWNLSVVLFSLLLARLTNASKFSDASYSRSCISATATRSRMSSTRNIDMFDSFCSTSALILAGSSKSTAFSCKAS